MCRDKQFWKSEQVVFEKGSYNSCVVLLETGAILFMNLPKGNCLNEMNRIRGNSPPSTSVTSVISIH